MPTAKLTVTVQVASIRKLDNWVQEGRYKTRSQAAQAALDLLERRNRLPTIEEKRWRLAREASTAAERRAWADELAVIDADAEANEPAMPDDLARQTA